MITQATARNIRNRGEVNLDPSLTVPNQAPALRVVLQKYIQGVHLPLGRKVYHDNLDDFESVDQTLAPDFDLTDAQIMEEQILEREDKLSKLKETLEAKKLKLKKEKEEQAQREKIKIELQKETEGEA